MNGMDKVVTFNQSQLLDDFLPISDENNAGTSNANRLVTLCSNFPKKA
jgi:hypothetical protein